MADTRFEPGGEYTCERCGRTFASDWSDEEATAEARENFSEAELAFPLAVICDDCYEEFMAWWRKLKGMVA